MPGEGASGYAGRLTRPDPEAAVAPDPPEHLAQADATPVSPARAVPVLIDVTREREKSRLTLFGEILDWLLVPLMLLWPVSVVMTYVSAKALTNPPYDRALAESAQVLAEQLKFRDGRITVDLPSPAREILRADEIDTVYFQVLGRRGEFLAGDKELPLPDDDEPAVPGQVQYRDGVVHGFEVRIAYIYARPEGMPAGGKPDDKTGRAALPLVQVAETLNKRAQLANDIVKGVILPQFIILPLAVTLVWFGLVRGLAPLGHLSERIRRRKPGDLSAIDHGAVPEEVAPLIRAINELMRELDSSLKGQQRFIANAAHQLRTPLAGLKTQTELALRQTGSDGDPRELRASLAQMALSTERAARMVNQLLVLTRAERGAPGDAEIHVRPTFCAVQLDRLVRDRVRDWVPAALVKHIDLGFDDEPDDAPVVKGDALLLAELVGNLIDNAIRYTPEGGVINVRVRAGTAGAGAMLEIEDSGAGIPEHERELVFERFYRVLGSDPEGRNLDGSGLGLAIVREIALRHKARVAISERAGGGAIFTVTFPRNS